MKLDENGQTIFNQAFAITFMEMALSEALTQLVQALGPSAPEALDRLETACLSGAKNATPADPGVPDNVMQSGVAFTLARLQQPFAKVRRDIGLG